MKQKTDPETPWRDAIVAEVRAARVALLAAPGYDLDRLARPGRVLAADTPHRSCAWHDRYSAVSAGRGLALLAPAGDRERSTDENRVESAHEHRRHRS